MSSKHITKLPCKEQLQMIEKFILDPYAYYLTGTDFDIVEYIYTIWPIYMYKSYNNRPTVYPHKNFFELLYSIKTNLMMLYTTPIYKQYPYFQLLGFLPLLENGADMIETILNKHCYSDAEEYIHFALLKFEPILFFTHLKRILLYNDIHHKKPSMDLHTWFLKELITDYQSQHILTDPNLQEFWRKNA